MLADIPSVLAVLRIKSVRMGAAVWLMGLLIWLPDSGGDVLEWVRECDEAKGPMCGGSPEGRAPVTEMRGFRLRRSHMAKNTKNTRPLMAPATPPTIFPVDDDDEEDEGAGVKVEDGVETASADVLVRDAEEAVAVSVGSDIETVLRVLAVVVDSAVVEEESALVVVVAGCDEVVDVEVELVVDEEEDVEVEVEDVVSVTPSGNTD